MNASQCIRILSERSGSSNSLACPCCSTDVEKTTQFIDAQGHRIDGIKNEFDSMNEMKNIILDGLWSQLNAIRSSGETMIESSALALLKTIVSVQEIRVQAYKFYNEALSEIIKNQSLQQYPKLCNAMTELFLQMSNLLIQIKVEFTRRNALVASTFAQSVIDAIIKIQENEKSKLMYVAALHLDTMQPQLPSLQSISGGCSIQRDYLNKKIIETENTIREALEDIQSYKIDAIEAEEI